jgi:DNA (cytosine-5)-methyltransferase 1
MYYLDLFAGAGGLSEGFIRTGMQPIAHIEMDRASSLTLKTRSAFHYYQSTGNSSKYYDYQSGKIKRNEFYNNLPKDILESVLNIEISDNKNNEIIREIDKVRNGRNIDLIIGGPPCQAYSVVGRARDKNKMKHDHRNHLYLQYAHFLNYFKPKGFVFENVPGLLSATDIDGKSYLSRMLKLFDQVGYSVEYKILNSKDFGVLQNRKRVILIGLHGNYSNFYPNFAVKEHNYKVNEIFESLPKLKSNSGKFGKTEYIDKNSEYLEKFKIYSDADFTTHHKSRFLNENDSKIYKTAVNKWKNGHIRLKYTDLDKKLMTHKNQKSFLNRFMVVADDLKYAQTVVAHISADGHYYIHPDNNQNRSITPREAARIQSFPDDYYFESIFDVPNLSSSYKQIGNAVPPLMAESVAKRIGEML